ncbi:phosphatase PAP2 family protein [Streptomyces californicus]|uniref:Phosphatase PAP2 family protein n=1 Tax=Streptomyces californicus TaxID=67351 RepID=A0ABD7D743_9ACTN|nr:phosphatase PAP2 family protein [Streptomyces californicus]QRV38786.1 phosphatase PAP2 family protein [Streptomyces californicus]QRV45471.1 phosphatase PAP2 family protein [Streptomyces californicus]QRV52155.1 phosphatase PAP2 family protein [Streptomyces californicus]
MRTSRPPRTRGPLRTTEAEAAEADATGPAQTAQTAGSAQSAPPRPGRSPALSSGAARAAARVGAFAVCQAALMVGAGLLLTGPARGLWPVTAEVAAVEALEDARTGTLDALSAVVSALGDTTTVVGLTFLVCLALVLAPRLPRWREAVFLATAVSLQAAVFVLITACVDRTRPDVERLDASPPTSSYTSGHTGAATALYAGLAVLVLSRVRAPWRKPVAALLLLVPLLVGLARLYRGMHHPTDVAGGLANGALSLFVVGRAVLDGHTWAARPPADAVDIAVDAAARRPAPARKHATVIVNPTVTDTATRERLRLVLAQHGYRDAPFVETTAQDPGGGRTAEALRAGAELVVVCGGDGTVRAVADALAGTGVPLVLVPCGTGNLLVRNLDLPLSPAEALAAGLTGEPRALDLGRIEGDGFPAVHFTAMAGAGLDAAMLEATSDRAKSVLGWPAYVLAGAKGLRAPRMRLTVRLDGGPELHRTARMVLVANVGAVQAGAAPVPAARPDDGVLDLAVFDPRGAGGWLRAAGVLLGGGRGAGEGRAVEFHTFRRAELSFTRPQPREVDGDPVGPGLSLAAEVRPGALTVMLPARER